MAETKTVQQVRSPFNGAEETFRDVYHTWTGFTKILTDLAFDAAEQNLRYSQTIRGQADQMLREGLTSYRRVYYEGLEAWQSYLSGVTETFRRN